MTTVPTIPSLWEEIAAGDSADACVRRVAAGPFSQLLASLPVAIERGELGIEHPLTIALQARRVRELAPRQEAHPDAAAWVLAVLMDEELAPVLQLPGAMDLLADSCDLSGQANLDAAPGIRSIFRALARDLQIEKRSTERQVEAASRAGLDAVVRRSLTARYGGGPA